MSKKNKESKPEKIPEEHENELEIEEVESNDSGNENEEESDQKIVDPLEDAKNDAAHWKDIAARNQAELDNYRKRMAREKSDAIRFANASLLSELLPVIDNFQMGLSAAMNEDPDSIISKGMEMVQKQLEEFFTSQGAIPVSAEGNEFNPNLHEAISQETSDTIPEGHVISEIRKGYTLNERLLRAANVIVSKGPENTDEDNES
ncbi:MAG: nucleotide exchange factor GrpE [Verrucomicrobiales bacterium]|nr:MAG: nucleotide exchange factor GrpE [Verrucomicrobiaceae bacterium TMED76]